jgi:ATP-binding cassette subfamily B multidrug efflux pump
MIRLLKYLKGSIVSVILIIALLVVQAMLDLTLPSYTADIINVGVEQGGIENAAITKIGKTSLDKLVLFMNDSDKSYVLNSYKESSTYKGETIYKLKSGVNTSKLSKKLEKPMTIVLYINKGSKSGSVNFNLPKGMDIYTALKYMNPSQKKVMYEGINSKLKKMPNSIISQAAISYVKTEYKRIGVNTDNIQNNYIFRVGALMILIALAICAVAVLIVYIGSRMAAGLAKTLRRKVFTKVVNFSKTEMKKFGVSSLITRTTNDIQQVQTVILFLFRVVFYAPIIGIGGVLKAMQTNSSMTYIIFLTVIVILGIVAILFAVAMPKFTMIQKLVDKLNLVTREILSGLPVIRAFANEKYEEKKFDNSNKEFTKVSLFVNKTMSLMMPMMMLIMNFVCLAIVYKGAYGVNNGSMQVGDIMAYIQYTMQIIMAFIMITVMSIMLPRANVSARRIDEIIKSPLSIKNKDKLLSFDPNLSGSVVFKNVSFRYPDANYDVITDINLEVKKGETVAFIGSTGSGKSTLINLLPRFYDVTSGEILIDGENINDVDLKELRARIGFVPQKGILFSGTISDNIKYGNNNISDKDIISALKVSQAEEFVNKLEGGSTYKISQGGTNVSGGQKQRLAIARAIAKNPEILVFDDSFSALDFATDAKLRASLKTNYKDKTILIVAQRISTIMDADKIVVLNEGNIVGMGTHRQLMKSCKVYQEIALSQLSKEELENA